MSDAYLASFFTTRAQLVSQNLFDVFRGEPGTPQERTMTNPRTSLQRVLTTGQPDQLPVQPYDVTEPTTGVRTERYWQPLNAPVRDARSILIARRVNRILWR